jgi:two-component system sensor histidine kinase UhpB
MFLDEDNSMIMLIIKDDGKGFDLTQHISNFGLAGMKERVDSVDGQIEIDTQAGEGVALTITIPKLREQE